MAAHDEIARLLKSAAASMKGDLAGAIRQLDAALALAREDGDGDVVALVAEDLARAWVRRRSPARSLRWALEATKAAPGRKAAWTTLAKTCELVAARTKAPEKQARARSLYRAAGKAFEKAASLTKVAEDRRWLEELGRDATRQGKPPAR